MTSKIVAIMKSVLSRAMSEKRVIFTSLAFVWLSVSKSQSSFFVARQQADDNFCVTNTSFALSWIDEPIKESLQQSSVYVPESESALSCDIKNDACTKTHFIKHPWSLQSGGSQIILDERWEEMEAIRTEFVSGFKERLRFVPSLKLQTANFDIPLSIRIEQEAHIFLCDGENPSESNCYWFLLHAFRGTRSAIRKCAKGNVPSTPQSPAIECLMRRISIDHPAVPPYLFSSKWSHFILSKQDGLLTFSSYADNIKAKILEWRDTEVPIAVTDMLVHSKLVDGLWKIHNLDFITTTIPKNNVELGPRVYAPEGFVCISMYVSMCRTCRIKLSLTRKQRVISEMTYKSEHTGWNQIKFITDSLTNAIPVQLLVSTIDDSPHPYWQVDKIRFCHQEEFRSIRLANEATCQLMSGNVIKFEDQLTPSTSNCPEDTIGPFCLKCNLIFDNCEEITICTGDTCVCSAGYSGEDCFDECDTNKYGHGCRKSCKKCFYSCDHIDGTCRLSKCRNNYSGPKCDIAPPLIFAEAPKVTHITADGATISVSDFEVLNNESDQPPKLYSVQYKKAKDYTWVYYNKKFTFKEPAQFRISNLNSQTQYLVRSVIFSISGKGYIGHQLKYASFTTTCEEINNNDIDVKTYSTSVFVTLLQTSHVTCRYTMSIFEIQLESYSNSSGTYFDHLEPFTEYTLKVQGPSQSHEKKFVTTEGVPDRIKDFVIISSSSSSVGLKWTAPKFHGKFKHYVVEYQHVSYKACEAKSSKKSMKISKTTTDNAMTITDLKPYSNYNITVLASNTNFDGEPYRQEIATSAADIVDLEEVPKIFNITTSRYAAIIELTKVNCENIRGPLTIKYTTICTSEWCLGQNSDAEIKNTSTSSIGLYFLTPFSDYQVELTFCQENGPCHSSEKRSFRTKPTVPGRVKNLLIYTKNGTSISLRWQAPTPPTGILKYYKIVYFDNKRIRRSLVVLVKPASASCELWPGFYCSTLSNLEDNINNYTLQVSARNEDPSDFGSHQQVTSTTQIEKSTAPYDLKIIWTLQNDLLLEWKHPNETNGDIKYFDITISEVPQRNPIKKQLNVNSNMYNLTYFYQVNAAEFIPTNQYNISVFAFNGERGWDTSKNTISPPEIPTIKENPVFDISNHTIGMRIVLKKIRGKTDNHRVVVLRSDKDANLNSYGELQRFDLRNFRVLVDCNFTDNNNSFSVFLGHSQEVAGCHDVNNTFLEPATFYNVTIIVMNTYGGTTRTKAYSMLIKTTGESNSELFALLLLLLIIPVAAFCYIKRKSICGRNRQMLALNNIGQNNIEERIDEIPLTQSQPKPKNHKPSKNADDFASHGTDHSKLVSVRNFYNNFRTILENQELTNEYENILENVVTYDTVMADTLRSDYVHMNFVNGLQVKNAYIITKLPEVAEFNEFWKIVEDENSHHIILFEHIQPNQKKNENYWPGMGKSLRCGDIIIECKLCQKYAFHTYRKFSLKCDNKIREVDQLHLSLPRNDKRYLSSLNYVEFFKKMSQVPHSSRSPILVHSSTDMRGTSFALLCDMSMRSAHIDGRIDVMAHFKTLLQTTTEMKIEFDHVVAAHAIIADTLNHMDTSCPCSSFGGTKSNLFTKEETQKHLHYLKDTLWLDELVIEVEKERYVNCSTILLKAKRPVGQSEVSVGDRWQSVHSDFIKVGGLRTPDKFWVAKRPTSIPLSEFLENVQEKNISMMITLNDNIFTWPDEDHPKMIISNDVTLEYKFIKMLECYDWITLELTTKTASQILEVVTFKKWSAPVVSLPKLDDFVHFVMESNEIFQHVEPVLVTCHDGVTSCGLFLAMSYILRQIKTENVCDVCTCVRTLRRHCRDFIKDENQYIYLVEAAYHYMREYSLYEVV